jgi:CRP-like cAMP-binding protein
MEKLWQAINRNSNLSEESWSLLSDICTKRQLQKNDFVLQQGEICKGFYFVNEGLLRNYYLKDGKQISEWFAFNGSFCFSIISFFKNVPSYLAIQCLEDSEVITISRDGIMSLKNRNFEIANLAFSLISNSLIMSQQRMLSLQFETAAQRYDNLINVHPNIIQRIPLRYIASYLGVSPETLSRIRSQVH